MTATVMDISEVGGLIGSRPLAVNKKTGLVRIMTQRGFAVNSMLRENEWKEVDAAVLESARYPLVGVQDLVSMGLTKPLGGLGSYVTQWYTSSEVTAASVNMSGTGRGDRDLPDLKPAAVPVPVIFKEFGIDLRQLLASRKSGDGLDVTAAAEASRVVAEGQENMLLNGASVTINGATVYGYRNHPSRNTDTAGNYGGGDWGTIANVVPTVAGMISAAMADYHYGPYVLYASTVQYNQATLAYYTDGSGETPAQRILKMPQISNFKMMPGLADGELLLVQMDRTVAEWAIAMGQQMREWVSGDGMQIMFRVMAVVAPRIKARYDGKSGLVHATGS